MDASDSPSLIPCVIHHRDGGYLCNDPRPKERDSAAVAYDKSVVPHRRYILHPKLSTSTSPDDQRFIRTKKEFFKVLDSLVGKEVAIKDAETEKYVTSEQGIYGKPMAKLKESKQYFHLERTKTGAYCFRTNIHKKELFLHKSSKSNSCDMKNKKGAVLSIETSQVNFSVENPSSNANDWIIEPDDDVIILDSLPTGENDICQGSIIFLGIVDISSDENGLEVSYHFGNVPAAWRTKEQWGQAIYALNCQSFKGDEYCIHTEHAGSNKTKWIARCARGKLCVVVASLNVHQVHLEECVDEMVDMLLLGQPTSSNLSELGWRIQLEEAKSTEMDNAKLHESEKLLEETNGTVPTTFALMKDVPISLLHRSGAWFSLNKNDSEPDLLYLEPVQDDRDEWLLLDKEGGSGAPAHDDRVEHNAASPITSTGDYFDQLSHHSKFAIRNGKGQYLFTRQRKNVIDKVNHKKKCFTYYAELMSPEEKPETFLFQQCSSTGAFSVNSASNGCFLTRTRKGEFVLMNRKENLVSSNGKADSGEEMWFIDSPDLYSGVSSDGLLFSSVVRVHDKKNLVSRHAPGRPTAWRTTESWDCMTDILLENIKTDSSTVVTDSDTGHQWFATNSNGAVLFIVIASAGLPLHYGTKALMAMEDMYQMVCDDGNGHPSNSDLCRIMRGIDTEYRYELCFGSSEVLDLIQDVDDLTEKMRANIEDIKKNIATEQEIEEKARQLHELAQQFGKRSKKKKYSVAAAAVAGGCVAGGVLGWLIGGPAGVVVLESQVAEIALYASLGAAPGVMKGIILLSTDKFWKRKFVNLGRCIDSRKKKRARGRRVANMEEKSSDNKVHLV